MITLCHAPQKWTNTFIINPKAASKICLIVDGLVDQRLEFIDKGEIHVKGVIGVHKVT